MSEPKPVSIAKIFWLLDYDGSMCPHREEWEFGHYNPESLCQILDTLAQKSRGLMWNTGRTVESLGSQSPNFMRHAGFFEHGAFFWDGKSKGTKNMIETARKQGLEVDVVNYAEEKS